MPYIKPPDRDKFILSLFNLPIINNAGEFNYFVSSICKKYLQVHGENYQNYNDLLGALEGIKLELYRRHTGPYEDKKITENGDI